MSGLRVVWVLGAGFSQPLGGPMLTDLLSEASERNLKACFPDADRLRDERAAIVRGLFGTGCEIETAGRSSEDDAMTELHQLDTSALSKLARPEHELVRKCLLREIDAGRIIVLATHPLLWEIPGARAVGPDHYRAMFDLLMQITDRRVLLTAPQRAALEIRAGGALSRDDIVDREKWIVLIGSDEEIDRAAAEQAGHARGLAFHEAERAHDAVDALDEEYRRQSRDQGQPFDPKEWRRGLNLKFREEAYVLDLADHYAGKDMRDVCAAEGLETTTSPQKRVGRCHGARESSRKESDCQTVPLT